MIGADDRDAAAIDRYLRHTGKVKVDDLDLDAARRAGLTSEEVFVLTYFADIEQQTLRNLRPLLAMRGAFEPALTAFLTTWNYEEFFHGQALAKLLEACGHPLASARTAEVSRSARFSEQLERLCAPLLAQLFAREFPAVYATFGAIHELTTLRGYERLEETTQNPVLARLAERIAKQERRHFAWYFQQAKKRLDGDRRAQLLTRTLLCAQWRPVGAGVKRDDEVARLFRALFAGEQASRVCDEIDAKIGSLPGLHALRLMRAYFADECRSARSHAHATRAGSTDMDSGRAPGLVERAPQQQGPL